MSKNTLDKVAKLKCKQSVIIYGRNSDGSPDECFKEGREYLFCVDEKKGEIFAFNDVKEVHFLDLVDYYTDKHFDIVKIDQVENFNLDEFTHAKMKKLFKERYDYSE
ncbi:hypothetical protein [Bacillus infantis]|uniref:hypothetical protein n=1 Tax=Bacillus infantis TaxID=324767 RepID=UPI00209FB3E7|nr:hypothetical protein [Bacillus infantis]MCP1159341.1 hypothetical protein [Bacillus infantis]